ncbi:hypothetical protein ACFC09_17080 [Streptomyces sp. NPDC056161]|uniref:hypothetical protein n=1 Tax=Streptomyces sp. NPDC056161 TaxID=3345732 RepID=UPI0035E034C1
MRENFALTWSVPDLEGIQQLRLVIEELRARATDVLRPGVTTDDLLLLLVSLGHAVQVTDECRPHPVEPAAAHLSCRAACRPP